MPTPRTQPKDFAAYLAAFPPATRARLQEVRDVIHATAPEAVDVISYAMPAFRLDGKILIYFAGYAHHIGLYPGAAAITHFTDAIAGYKSAKGSVQLPLDAPLPVALVQDMVTYCVQQRRADGRAKKAR
jgi:uncharacterized protein YdhG (YjbR/CyaY superfamily)